MKSNVHKSIRQFAGICALSLPLGAAGCDSPQGTGTITIGDAEAVRAKVAGPAVDKPGSEKQSKAVEAELDAAKKHPKLR